MDVTESLNERVVDALMAAGKRTLADEYAAAKGGDDDGSRPRQCEDFPCCGHERGDCDGSLYGSDESIKADPHLLCDHNTGYCEVWDREQDNEGDDDGWCPQHGWDCGDFHLSLEEGR